MNMAKIEARAAELHEGCQMPMEQARELAAREDETDWHARGQDWALADSLSWSLPLDWTAGDIARAFAAGAKAALAQSEQQPVQSVPRAWRNTLRELAFMARTSGGTAGPDSGLMMALNKAEALLSLPYAPTAQPQQEPTSAQPEQPDGRIKTMANTSLAAAFGAADAAKEQDLRGYYQMAARVLADEVRNRRAALDQMHAEYEDMKSLLLGNARNLKTALDACIARSKPHVP